MDSTFSILCQNYIRRVVIRIYLRISYCELADIWLHNNNNNNTENTLTLANRS